MSFVGVTAMSKYNPSYQPQPQPLADCVRRLAGEAIEKLLKCGANEFELDDIRVTVRRSIRIGTHATATAKVSVRVTEYENGVF